MYSDLARALGIENYIEPEVLPPVTEVEMNQSYHVLNTALNEVSTVEQDIKSVAGYTDIIERIDPDELNADVTTEAIYIGLEHILNKHQIRVDELFPSLETWSMHPKHTKQVSLENVHSLMKGLKQKGKEALDWLIKKYHEWREKLKNFFRTVFKKKVQEEVKKNEAGATAVQKEMNKASPEEKKIVEEKLKEQPMVKDAKVTNQAVVTVNLDDKQAYVIKLGKGHINDQFEVIAKLMSYSNILGVMEEPGAGFSEQMQAISGKDKVLQGLANLSAKSKSLRNKEAGIYSFETFTRCPTLNFSKENNVFSYTADIDYSKVVTENDKIIMLDKSTHDQLNDEIKYLLDVYDKYLNDSKMLDNMKRGSVKLDSVSDSTTGIVKFVLDCSIQHMESVRLAIEVRRQILKNYPVSLDDLSSWLNSQDAP